MALSKNPKARSKQLANRRDAPPAAKGNKRALKHGATASPEPRRQAALERQLALMVPVKDDDGKPNPSDWIVIRLLAIVLVRLESVVKYTSKHGAISRGGKLSAAAAYEEKLTVRAQNLCAELGMSPKSRVALGLQIKQAEHLDLAQLLSGDTPSRKPKQLPEPIQDAEVIEDD